MATTCNEKFVTCDEANVEDCQRTEINRSRKISGENTATTVSSTMAPISHAELQDLPIEVLDYILMKAVVKKVMDRKLAKSVWLNYASRVIQPMRIVWSRWNYSLATNWFRIVLSRILSNKDPAAILVAAIAEEPCDSSYAAFAKLGNQIYFACYDQEVGGDFCLEGFEVRDLSHCTKTISLPVTECPVGLAACKQSNSIYVWGCGLDVLHLVPDGNGDFEVLFWPPYSPPSDFLDGCDPTANYSRINSFSVLDDGNLVVQRFFMRKVDPASAYDVNDIKNNILSVHRPDGFVVRNVKLPKIYESSNVVMKSDGNFVYVNLEDAIVTEVDRDGKEVRNFHWKVDGVHEYQRLFLDSYDRVMLLDNNLNLVFLDTELNFLCKFQLDAELEEFTFSDACFYKETNELIVFSGCGDIVFAKLAL